MYVRLAISLATAFITLQSTCFYCSTKCILLYITIYHEITKGYGSGAWLWTIWHHYYQCIVIILYILFAYAVCKLA
ncbi:hypothetical protein Golax_002920, partial [Gossypium laxum]|nr:hypothetical protein [Gossypium laxum]